MLSVIGIHTTSKGISSFARGAHEGHAWLTLHFTNGHYDSVGLWPAGGRSQAIQPRLFIRDPIGIRSDMEETFDVIFGFEKTHGYKAHASRFYGLHSNEYHKAIMAIGQFSGWRLTHNCATWATAKIRDIFGPNLASIEFFGVPDTPRALEQKIKHLEALHPTSVSTPYYMY